ncbi:MAG: Na+/H+ antiporter subunit E [Wenzhouxiangellaceae bacterium]|nr:Na+/H+ antiporter subunit E [Wenzhouxiangellaceae bacterium]
MPDPGSHGQPRLDRLKWSVQTFVLLFSAWLILDGGQAIALGVAACTVASVLAAMLAPDHRHLWLRWQLAGFLLFFLQESLRGGIDVAWRALHPKMPIQPAFERHRLTLPEGQPRTLLISAISMLPGTLSADLEDHRQTLLVHSLHPKAAASIARLERMIHWLFSLPGSAE